MLLSEIRNEIKLVVSDEAFTDDMIDSYINDVYKQVVASCLVPELKGIDTVVTSTTASYTSLTGVDGGFSGVLSRVYNSSNEGITIYSKLEELMDLGDFFTSTGSTEAVALEGNILWYFPVPVTAEVLTLVYYKNPVVIVDDTDSPSSIPDFLHRQILVNGVSAVLFDIFEDGIDGVKVNTMSRERAKLDGVVRFREWLGKTRKHYIVSQDPA
jgi:hypothetical protein